MNITKLKDSLNHEDEITFISNWLGLTKDHINKWYIFDKPIYDKNTIFYSINKLNESTIFQYTNNELVLRNDLMRYLKSRLVPTENINFTLVDLQYLGNINFILFQVAFFKEKNKRFNIERLVCTSVFLDV